MADERPEGGELTVSEQAELAGYEEAMADTTAWGNDKASQQRAIELYAKAEGEASEIGQISRTVARQLEIEGMMTEKHGAYWHSPSLQNEYKALLEGGDQQLATLEQRQADPEQQQAIARAGELGKRMDVALGDALGGIEASWDGLDDTLQGAIAREMGTPVPDAKDAASNELEVFRRMPTGAIMSSWWAGMRPITLAFSVIVWTGLRARSTMRTSRAGRTGSIKG